MSKQSLNKIGQKLHKLRVLKQRADGWADGRTDTQNFKILGGYNIISRHFCVAGYKNQNKILSASYLKKYLS